MNAAIPKREIDHSDLIESLKSSPFYQVCQNAFREATDLPLVVTSLNHSDFNPCHASPHQNSFCQLMNFSHGACEKCVMAQQRLHVEAQKQTYTLTCFAGLEETAVPLRLGRNIIGFLQTGQIFTKPPQAAQFKTINDAAVSASFTEVETRRLIKSYRQTPVFEKEKYASMITLLSIISLQLTEFLNRLMLEGESHEPDIISQAKAWIADRIDEKISLAEISRETHVSVFYFCKLFKQSTGMTLTEYVNRQRIELAKGELKNTEKPVTEIAYAVGFQSLSPFNRSFLKYVGESPRQYRKHVRDTKMYSSDLLL
jgi:AraC-like DNA-binding protein/ligand-binding sensor protein